MDLLICMKSFVAVVDNQGFASASRAIYISPPNLSRQVRFLEDWIGGVLLERSTRKVELTSLGQSYYPKAKLLLANVDSMKNSAQDYSAKVEGCLTISLPAKFGRDFMLPKICKFIHEYPDVRFKLTTRNAPIYAINDDADVAISNMDIHEHGLKREVILNDAVCISASPDYLEKFGVPKTPHDLIDHACLINLNRLNSDLWTFKKNVTVKVQNTFASDSAAILLDATLQGIGIFKSSGYIVKPYYKDKKLIPLLSDYVIGERRFYAYYRKNPVKQLLVDAFVDWIT